MLDLGDSDLTEYFYDNYTLTNYLNLKKQRVRKTCQTCTVA